MSYEKVEKTGFCYEDGLYYRSALDEGWEVHIAVDPEFFSNSVNVKCVKKILANVLKPYEIEAKVVFTPSNDTSGKEIVLLFPSTGDEIPFFSYNHDILADPRERYIDYEKVLFKLWSALQQAKVPLQFTPPVGDRSIATSNDVATSPFSFSTKFGWKDEDKKEGRYHVLTTLDLLDLGLVKRQRNYGEDTVWTPTKLAQAGITAKKLAREGVNAEDLIATGFAPNTVLAARSAAGNENRQKDYLNDIHPLLLVQFPIEKLMASGVNYAPHKKVVARRKLHHQKHKNDVEQAKLYVKEAINELWVLANADDLKEEEIPYQDLLCYDGLLEDLKELLNECQEESANAEEILNDHVDFQFLLDGYPLNESEEGYSENQWITRLRGFTELTPDDVEECITELRKSFNKKVKTICDDFPLSLTTYFNSALTESDVNTLVTAEPHKMQEIYQKIKLCNEGSLTMRTLFVRDFGSDYAVLNPANYDDALERLKSLQTTLVAGSEFNATIDELVQKIEDRVRKFPLDVNDQDLIDALNQTANFLLPQCQPKNISVENYQRMLDNYKDLAAKIHGKPSGAKKVAGAMLTVLGVMTLPLLPVSIPSFVAAGILFHKSKRHGMSKRMQTLRTNKKAMLKRHQQRHQQWHIDKKTPPTKDALTRMWRDLLSSPPTREQRYQRIVDQGQGSQGQGSQGQGSQEPKVTPDGLM